MKKFYLVGALGLSDATERRYGVVGPRRGRGLLGDEFLGKRTNGERKEEREKKQKIPFVVRSRFPVGPTVNFRPSRPPVRPRTFARENPARIEKEALDEHHPQDKRANSFCVSLEELFFLRPSRHVPTSLRCPAVPTKRKSERERKRKRDEYGEEEREREREREREKESQSGRGRRGREVTPCRSRQTASGKMKNRVLLKSALLLLLIAADGLVTALEVSFF